MQFEFATANRIIFGNGTIKQVGAISKSIGRRAMVVCGKNIHRAEPLFEQLARSDIEFISLQIKDEPTIPVVCEGLQRARKEKCDLVMGFGGGSALDAGKVIAAMITNGGDLLDYLEVIGNGKTISNKPVPYISNSRSSAKSLK